MTVMVFVSENLTGFVWERVLKGQSTGANVRYLM